MEDEEKDEVAWSSSVPKKAKRKEGGLVCHAPLIFLLPCHRDDAAANEYTGL